MKRTTKLLVAVATTLSTAVFAGAGWTYWATNGSGSATASVGNLAAPTGVTVPATSSGTVAVSWTASSAVSPNVTPQGYYVERSSNGTTWTAACGSSPTVFKTSPCNDTASDGTYTYRVTAVFKSWTAQSAPSGQVTVTTDSTPPTLTSLQMFDTSANGKIDQVKATFSETLASSTATAPWALANVPSGGTLSSVATSGTVATLTLTEGANAPNTAVGTFTVALAANAAGIRDAAGNQASFAATAPADKAAPALITLQMLDINTNGKVDQVKATFSEALASYTAGTTPWTLANVPSGGLLGSVSVASPTATLTITEGAGAADTAVGSFAVAMAPSATGIRDAASNESSFTATAPADLAKPVLVSATSGGGTAGLMQSGDTLSLTFSEALDRTSVPASVTVTESRSGQSTLSIPGVIASADIANGYLGGNNSSGAATGTIAWSADSKLLTITLGAITTTGSGVGTGTGAVFMTPAAAIKDSAGNTVVITTPPTVSRLF